LPASAIVIHPESELAVGGKTFQLSLAYEVSSLKGVIVYRSTTHTITWQRIDASKKNGVLIIRASAGGMYIITEHTKVGVVTGIAVMVLVTVGAIILAVICVLRKRTHRRYCH